MIVTPQGGTLVSLLDGIDRGQEFAVGRQDNFPDALVVCDLSKLLARGHVPEAEGLVVAAGNQRLAVGRESDGPDNVLVPF